jgi:anti-anti-sigma factor
MLEPTVTSTQLDGVAIVALHGEHDVSTVDKLHSVLEAHMATDSRMVIDLTDATFIDSSVLNAILASHKQFKGVGAVALGRHP